MTDRVLSDAEVEKMETPVWDAGEGRDRRGRPRRRRRRSSTARSTQWAGLKDYSINWITSLLTFVADELGEEAVERALRKTGDEFVRPRRDHRHRLGRRCPAAQRAKVIARAMLANMGEVEVSEDDEKIVLAFRCGTGGKLIDDGRYEGEHPYRTLREPAGRTFSRDELPGLLRALLGQQRDPAGGVGRRRRRASSTRPSGRGSGASTTSTRTCDAIPDEAYVRIGKPPPRPTALRREHRAMEIRTLGPDDVDAVVAASELFDGPATERIAQRFLDSEGHHLLVAYEDGGAGRASSAGSR